jgi:hypothetical protein
MSEIGKRRLIRNIYEADWQGMYIIGEQWKSDLLFYNDDLKFLEHLKEKYFNRVFNNEEITRVLKIEITLNQVKLKCEELLINTYQHLTKIARLIDVPFKYDSYLIRKEHDCLEFEILNFIKQYRSNKAAVFAMAEQVMENSELA